MNVRLGEIVSEIEDTRKSLYSIVGGLSQKEFDEPSDPDVWSISKILHHLYLVETQITKLLKKQIEKAEKRGIGPDPEKKSIIGCLDSFAFEAGETKLKAPSITVPQQYIKKGELMESLQCSRTELLDIVSKASSYNLSELLFPHPIFGKLNMYQWILFVGKHENHHMVQIENIIRTK